MKKQALYEPVGILDMPDKVGQSISGVPIAGIDEEITIWKEKGITLAFLTLGSVRDTKLREKLVGNAKKNGFSFPVIIDPSAVMADYVEIEAGTYILDSRQHLTMQGVDA